MITINIAGDFCVALLGNLTIGNKLLTAIGGG